MLLLARKIGLARVHACRANRLLPGHDGHVPFSFFPSICYVSACSYESNAVWHPFALRKGVLSTPELLRRLALAVRCERWHLQCTV